MTRAQFIFSLIFFTVAFAFMMLVAVLPVPAHADCISVQAIKDRVSGSFPKASMSEIGGTEMTAFLFGFNSIKPPTALVADYALVFRDDVRPDVAIALFAYGCFSTVVFLKKEEFDKLMLSL